MPPTVVLPDIATALRSLQRVVGAATCDESNSDEPGEAGQLRESVLAGLQEAIRGLEEAQHPDPLHNYERVLTQSFLGNECQGLLRAGFGEGMIVCATPEDRTDALVALVAIFQEASRIALLSKNYWFWNRYYALARMAGDGVCEVVQHPR
jgi:hypothetical protein